MTAEGIGNAAAAAPESGVDEAAGGQPDPDATSGESTRRSARPLSGLGKRFSGNGSAQDATEERLHTESDARSYFAGAHIRSDTLFSGDQTGDHHHHYYGGTGEQQNGRPYPFSAEEVAETAEAFVPPAGYAALAEAAERMSLVILRGPVGGGRDAAARRLLSESPGRPMLRMHEGTDLGALDADTLELGGRYLLSVGHSDAREAALGSLDLRHLAATLRDRDVQLVITASSSACMNRRDAADFLLDLGAPADPRDVVRAQLRWRLRDGPGLADRLLADPAVAALLAERLHDGVPLAKAAMIARWLAEAAEPVPEAAEFVRRKLSADEQAEFEARFEGLADLPTQCLAIAIAVFGGEPYETVAEAARRLQVRLQPPEDAETGERRRSDPFRASQRRRLEAVQARLVMSDVAMRHGRAPTRVVRYVDDLAPLRVLMFVWREYDDIRADFIDWLRECALSERWSMGVRTAIATGVLAQESFDYVRTEVIVPWAGSADPALRYAAAKALQLAAERPGLTRMVRNLIATWSSEDEKGPELAATAVRAWRVELDAAGLGAALALLDRRAGTNNVDVALAVADGCTELFAVGNGAHAGELLAMLRRWTAGRDRERTTVGVLSFLQACADFVDRVPTTSGDLVAWPALLRLAAHDGGRHRDVAALWELALHSGELHEAARTALDRWARTAEPDATVRGCFARLLRASATRNRTERLIRRRAAAWADPSSGVAAPNTARELLSILDEERRSR